MRTRLISLLPILVMFVFCEASGRASGGAQLVVTFRCSSITSCSTPDRIDGDGSPYYSTNGMSVSFDTSGDLDFRMPLGSRSLFLDFSSPDSPNPNTPPFGTAWTTSSATIFSTPVDSSGSQLKSGFNSMSPGETLRASFRLAFPDPGGNGTNWFVWFAPSQYASSQFVTVTRSATSPATWTMVATTPSGLPVDGQIAGLANVNNTHKTTITDTGLYNMSFAMTVCTQASATIDPATGNLVCPM